MFEFYINMKQIVCSFACVATYRSRLNICCVCTVQSHDVNTHERKQRKGNGC